MKQSILLPLLVLFVLVSVHESNAGVQVVDWNDNEKSQESPPGFNQGTIETGGTTGDTEAGDYVIIACSTTIDVSNSFNSPTPGLDTVGRGRLRPGSGMYKRDMGEIYGRP